jgi:predicted Fe-Mo cluster-binding NifX family protein
MRYAIPVENINGMKSVLYGHFGSAPSYALFDSDTNGVDFLSNDNHQHLHGQCQPAVSIINKNIQAVVCAGMGVRAITNLNAAGIKVYRCLKAQFLEDAISEITNNRIQEMKSEQACSEHRCH